MCHAVVDAELKKQHATQSRRSLDVLVVFNVVDVASRVFGFHADCHGLQVRVDQAPAFAMDALSHRKMCAGHGMRASQFRPDNRCEDYMELMLYWHLLDIRFR